MNDQEVIVGSSQTIIVSADNTSQTVIAGVTDTEPEVNVSSSLVGIPGPIGPDGPANVLSIGTVEGGTVAAATIAGTTPAQVLNLVLPQGETGDTGNGIVSIVKTSTLGLVDTYTVTYTDATTSTFNVTNGDDGVGIVSITKTDTVDLVDTYTITYSDASTSTFDVTNGEKGDTGLTGATGPANTLSIGTVTEGPTAATITGVAPNQTLNLTLAKGNTGATGPANTLSIGTVTQGPTAATITGTAPDQTLNLVLQKGDIGPQGISLRDKGVYSAGTAYVNNTEFIDFVTYNGSSYYALQDTTGNLPTDAAYWAVLAQKGIDGAGAGDMLASVYDPSTRAESMAFASDLTNLSTKSFAVAMAVALG